MKINFAKITMVFLLSICTLQVKSQVKDAARLRTSTGIILGASVASFGILYILPESFTNWDKSTMSLSSMGSDWVSNVKKGPVWDRDGFTVNWIMHPYCGALYYMTSRSVGYSWYESFGYSVLMSSVFWEYGIEAFAEIPSWQDLFVTPIIGSMVGEGFHRFKQQINLNNDELFGKRWIGRTTLLLIDPLNEIQDRLVGKAKNTHNHVASWFGPVATRDRFGAYGLNVYVSF